MTTSLMSFVISSTLVPTRRGRAEHMGGFRPGKRPNIERNREGVLRLCNDYFATNSIYPNEHFERRF